MSHSQESTSLDSMVRLLQLSIRYVLLPAALLSGVFSVLIVYASVLSAFSYPGNYIENVIAFVKSIHSLLTQDFDNFVRLPASKINKYNYEVYLISYAKGVGVLIAPVMLLFFSYKMSEKYPAFRDKAGETLLYLLGVFTLIVVPFSLYLRVAGLPFQIRYFNLFIQIAAVSSFLFVRYINVDSYIWESKSKSKISGRESNNRKTEKDSRSSYLKSQKRKTESQIYLGVSVKKKKPFPVHIDIAQVNSHAHVLGATGAGKSVTLRCFIDYVIANDIACVFVDGKGDLDFAIENYTRLKTVDKQDRFRFFSTDYPKHSCPYNPFYDGLDGTELKDKLMSIVNWSEAYYERVANQLTQIAMNALKNTGRYFHIEHIIKTVSDIKYLEGVLSMAENKAYKKKAQLGLDQLDKKGIKDASAISFDLHSLWDSPFGQNLQKTPTLDLWHSLYERSDFVHFSLNMQRFNNAGVELGKIILSDIKCLASKIEAKVPKELRKPIFVIVDEFAQFTNQQFVNLLVTARSSGMHIVISHQDLSQLSRCSEDFKDIVVSNTNVKIVHAQDSSSSASELSEIFGTAEKTLWTQAEDADEEIKGFSARSAREFRVHPDEIKDLRCGEAVIQAKRGAGEPVRDIVQIHFDPVDPMEKESFFEEVSKLNESLPAIPVPEVLSLDFGDAKSVREEDVSKLV